MNRGTFNKLPFFPRVEEENNCKRDMIKSRLTEKNVLLPSLIKSVISETQTRLMISRQTDIWFAKYVRKDTETSIEIGDGKTKCSVLRQ